MREIRSFVVRVYRRDSKGISGVVQDVQTGCFHSFHSAPDLWKVLASQDPEIPSEGKPK
jgi:hypothetical protein